MLKYYYKTNEMTLEEFLQGFAGSNYNVSVTPTESYIKEQISKYKEIEEYHISQAAKASEKVQELTDQLEKQKE